MALIDLYDGIAVVIDDEIHDSESGIGIIVIVNVINLCA